MRKVVLWTIAAAFLLGIFETAILSHIRFLPALPDLILILVVYIALHNGTVAGVTAGFFSGLIFDCPSRRWGSILLYLPYSVSFTDCCTENIMYAASFFHSYSAFPLHF